MLSSGQSYAEMRAGFRWDLPARLNMARQALAGPSDQVAIIDPARGDTTYARLEAMSAGLAQELRKSHGITAGDRIGVLRSQDAWCAAAHLAIWSLGAISVPLFTLFQGQALDVRTADAGCRVIITDPANAERTMTAPALVPDTLPISDIPLAIADTDPETPACLIYTSGTTGPPKGALHGHRMLTGHLPGVEMSHDFLGRPGDILWTPADWAWIGGLFDVLMPGLALGVPVVAARLTKFEADACADIVARTGARNIFFPPTALRILKAADQDLMGLRSVASGGEPLGAEMLAWGRKAFGLDINEFYGQTECNMVASAAASLFAPRGGCIGKPVPGFELAVLDDAGEPTAHEGDIAISKGAASMMLGYWNKPDATREKYRGEWMLTGDRGIWEAEYLRFVAREDDVISSGGYRIGPAEIEDCLMTHPDVATVGVIGKPDALRTEIVKAYVVLKKGIMPSNDLAIDLQAFVKHRLAAYSYPREVTFLDALPMTVTGKVIRNELKARACAELESAT